MPCRNVLEDKLYATICLQNSESFFRMSLTFQECTLQTEVLNQLSKLLESFSGALESFGHKEHAEYAIQGVDNLQKFKEQVIQNYLGTPNEQFGASPKEYKESKELGISNQEVSPSPPPAASSVPLGWFEPQPNCDGVKRAESPGNGRASSSTFTRAGTPPNEPVGHPKIRSMSSPNHGECCPSQRQQQPTVKGKAARVAGKVHESQAKLWKWLRTPFGTSTSPVVSSRASDSFDDLSSDLVLPHG